METCTNQIIPDEIWPLLDETKITYIHKTQWYIQYRYILLIVSYRIIADQRLIDTCTNVYTMWYTNLNLYDWNAVHQSAWMRMTINSYIRLLKHLKKIIFISFCSDWKCVKWTNDSRKNQPIQMNVGCGVLFGDVATSMFVCLFITHTKKKI